MSTNNLINFADELKKQRKSKKISIQQISAKTRIDIQFLEAIEQGNFDVMSDVYIQAFIKEYAQCIGIDPEETIEKYKSARLGKNYHAPESNSADVTSEQDIKEKTFNDSKDLPATSFSKPGFSNLPPWGMPLIVAVSLVIIIIAIYALFFSSSNNRVIVEKPFKEVISEKKARFEIKPEVKTEKKEKTKIDSLFLTFIAQDTSWIGVTLDDTLKTDFILFPDRKKTLKAEKLFVVTLGNSAGVNILLNSDTLKFGKKYKTVRKLTINKNGIVNSAK